ncbi:hypothetical protein CAEBREN_21247 [Caenorhabditis brenneri]|uniref:Uncharacterized protein n=1 Tax=Caenorhabditis brenneri TaxID=135651 RepID=G0MP00_CAEBE|nr:hypothetical protein CAEBREN_21247 [Caenorhabditis brenneri]
MGKIGWPMTYLSRRCTEEEEQMEECETSGKGDQMEYVLMVMVNFNTFAYTDCLISSRKLNSSRNLHSSVHNVFNKSIHVIRLPMNGRKEEQAQEGEKTRLSKK